jgi:Rrf2 family protein
MLLNQTAEYAFRAMAFLASRHLTNEDRITAKELSKATNIPTYYLSKIMRRLVVANLVDGLRGHRGGFKLAREPDQILFADVLSAIDYQSEVGRCAFGIGRCDGTDPCLLHASWSKLLDDFTSWATTHSLMHAAELPQIPPMSR